jgi:ribosomal protein S18 acetylase RimI-like enzyme
MGFKPATLPNGRASVSASGCEQGTPGSSHGTPIQPQRCMSIRAIVAEDLAALGTIHKSAYSRDHFTSTFSVKLLASYYAHCVRLNPYSYIAIDSATQEPLGFVVAGFCTAAAIRSFVKEHYLDIGMRLLSHPRFMLEKLSALVRPKSVHSTCSGRLLSIAVARAHQSKGVGVSLFQHLETNLRANQVFTYGLSVRVANTAALTLYKRCGFVVECESRGTVYLIKHLSSV